MSQLNKLEIELSKLFAEAIFKHRKIKPSANARRQLEERARKAHFAPFFVDGGGIFLRRNSQGKLIAAVLMVPQAASFKLRRPSVKFIVVSLPQDKISLKWAESVLEQHVSLLGSDCSGRLECWQKSLVPWFERNKINVRSVQLNGEVDTSLKRLRSHYGKSLREPFEKEGLVIRPARKKSEIEAYLRILLSEYSRNPQFGVFVANPTFLGFVRKDMKAGLAKEKKALWLVYKNKELIGGVDINELPKGVDGKTRAAFGVNLTAKAQGKQFSRAIYETILLELQSRGIKIYFGNTGQPGVMRLGKIMGRWLSGIELDRGIAKPFPKGHFRGWI